MVHVVGFRDGKAFYRNRFVRTDGFLAEQEAGQAAVGRPRRGPGALAQRRPGGAPAARMKDASSTDVIVHNGVALTSFYQCGDLYRLDPTTLETLGKADVGRPVPARRGVSAHPKVDEHTGELLFFNYSTDGAVHALRRGGRRRQPGPLHRRAAAGAAAAARHGVHRELRDPQRHAAVLGARGAARAGKYAARFHPDIPTRLAVIPRRGSTADIRWFEADPTYVLHWVNAYEDGDEIVLDGYFQVDPEPAAGNGTFYQRMFRFLDNSLMGPKLHRWRLNLATGLAKEERLSETTSEFGMINGRHAGRRHRYSYSATARARLVPVQRPGQARQRDRHRGELPPRRRRLRQRDGDGSAGRLDREDDGYLVTIIYRHEPRHVRVPGLRRARSLADGPIARVRLPERVSSGTHSTWAAGAAIPGWGAVDRAADAVV